MICHDMSFCHSSDCHTYYRTHLHFVMTLFLELAPCPICHSSSLSPFTLPLITRLSAIHRFVSFSLFQSFPRPSIARPYRLCDSPLTVSLFHSSCASFQSSRSSFPHTDVRLLVSGRWPSAKRHLSSFTVRPIH